MKNSEFEKLTIATSCMNRNDMLIETVPTWLKFPVKEIIIVDWSSTVSVKTTLEENHIIDERIRIISVLIIALRVYTNKLFRRIVLKSGKK